MKELGIAFIWCSIQVTLVTVVAFAVHCAARRRKHVGPAISFLTLVTIGAITAAAFLPIPSWFVATERQVSRVESGIAAQDSLVEGLNEGELADEDPAGASEAVDSESVSSPEFSGQAAVSFGDLFIEELSMVDWNLEDVPQRGWTWQGVVACIFMGFVGVGCGQWLIGLWWVSRYRRRSELLLDAAVLDVVSSFSAAIGLKRNVEVRVFDGLSSAATVGWMRPLILLPGNWAMWDATQLRCVLAHELAHIHRRDFVACVLGQLSVALHFYHPLVHWLVGRLKLEQELAADALAATIVDSRKLYMTSLAELALLQDNQLVIGPARSFLPSSKTLMRRIEMLKGTNGSTGCGIPTVLKYGAALAILCSAVVAMGLRGPVISLPQSAIAQEPVSDNEANGANDKPAQNAADIVSADSRRGAAEKSRAAKDRGKRKSLPHSLAFVPRDTPLVMSIRPALMLSDSAMTPFTKAIADSQVVQQTFGIDLDDIDQMTVLIMSEEDESMNRVGPAGFVLRLYSAKEVAAFKERVGAEAKVITYDGQEYFATQSLSFFVADETTIVVGVEQPIMRRMIIAGKEGADSSPWAGAWRGLPDDDLVIHWDMELFHPSFAPGQDVVNGPVPTYPPAPVYAPAHSRWDALTKDVKSLALTGKLDGGLSLRVQAQYANQSQSHEAVARLSGMIGWMRQSLAKLRRQLSQDPSAEGAIGLRGTSLLDTLIDNRKVDVNDGDLVVQTKLNETQLRQMVTSLAPAVFAARTAAKRTKSMNNIRMLGLAMHNYHDAYGRLPRAANYLMADQKTKSEHPHSWRIALLPFLDHQALYRWYKFDEPWDSENNRKVLAQMPDVFRSPLAEEVTTASNYFVASGKSGLFSAEPNGQHRGFRDVLDGLSNTIMIVEAKREIPWTKPADIEFDVNKPVPELGGLHPEGYNVGMFDGSVRFLQDVDEKVLKALLTSSGKESSPYPN